MCACRARNADARTTRNANALTTSLLLCSVPYRPDSLCPLVSPRGSSNQRSREGAVRAAWWGSLRLFFIVVACCIRRHVVAPRQAIKRATSFIHPCQPIVTDVICNTDCEATPSHTSNRILVWRHRDANANFDLLPGRRRHPLRRDETSEQPARSEAAPCVAKDRRSCAVQALTRCNPLNESCFVLTERNLALKELSQRN